MVKVETWDKATQSVVVRELSREEYLAEFGEDATLFDPVVPESELTESERSLMNRMQAEQGVNEAARRAGIKSIFDLPQHNDTPEAA